MAMFKKEVPRNWQEAYATPKRILKLTGLWPNEQNTFITVVKTNTFVLIALIFYAMNLLELKDLILMKDYELLSQHLSTLGSFSAYMINLFIFKYNHIPFRNLINNLESSTFEVFPQISIKYMKGCILTSDSISKFYIFTVAATLILFLSKPLYTEMSLPVIFTADLSQAVHNVVLCFQIFSVYYLVMAGISLEMVFISLINIATAKMDILCEAISSFEATSQDSLEYEENVFLDKCVQKHYSIIRFVDEIERVFCFIFLVQSLASIVCICNGGFLLTHTDKLLSVAFMFNCAFIFNVLFEIGICYWFAGLLTVKSLAISDACYHFNWLDSTKKTKKNILIILCRGQKPLFITAGKFTRLSLSSFLAVLKTAYSYFALMQTLYDKNERNM